MSSTNFCYCWEITPEVGSPLRYTTTDSDLEFLGDTYKTVGVTPDTIIQKTLGLGSDNLEFVGAITEEITFEDLRSGKFVDARVKGYRVNLEDLSDNDLEFTGRVGQFAYDDFTFRAEIRSLSSVVSESVGDVYTRNCRYDLGSEPCSVDLSSYTETAQVSSVSGKTVTLSSSLTDGYYTFGRLVAPDGFEQDIREQVGAVVTLWDRASVEVGQTVTLKAGCDKLRQTCKSKFNNIKNYGGFDLIPTEDILTDFAVQGKDVYDGSSYFEQLD